MACVITLEGPPQVVAQLLDAQGRVDFDRVVPALSVLGQIPGLNPCKWLAAHWGTSANAEDTEVHAAADVALVRFRAHTAPEPVFEALASMCPSAVLAAFVADGRDVQKLVYSHGRLALRSWALRDRDRLTRALQFRPLLDLARADFADLAKMGGASREGAAPTATYLACVATLAALRQRLSETEECAGST